MGISIMATHAERPILQNQRPCSGLTKSCAQRPTRTLDQFQSGLEVLIALRDAIMAHRKSFIASGTIQGHIDPYSINITNISGEGIPCCPTSTPHMHMPHISSPRGNSRFQSANNLARDVLKRSSTTCFPADYSDDLESFWYILAYICMGFAAPGDGPHIAQNRALASWALHSDARESALEKEAMVMGQGFSYGNTMPFFNGFVFEPLLDEMHVVLRNRHLKRLDLGRPRIREEQLDECIMDYSLILESFDKKIAMLERFEGPGYVVEGGEEWEVDSEEEDEESEDGSSEDNITDSDSVIVPFFMDACKVTVIKY